MHEEHTDILQLVFWFFQDQDYVEETDFDDDDDDDDDEDDNEDDDDDDDEVSTKKFFKFLHIRPHKHAWCQLLAVGTTPCGKGFYY